MTVKAKEIQLVQTCSACPEQYDAYWDENKVGYLRLRHGIFSVECNSEVVYHAYPKGDGLFDYDERGWHLKKARKAIAKWVNKKGKFDEPR